MYKQNRGATTDIRHILYDIAGNIVVYLLCWIVFVAFLGYSELSSIRTLIAAALYMVVYLLAGTGLKVYDITTFYYPDRVARNVLFSCILATLTVSAAFYMVGRAQYTRSFYLAYFILSAIGLFSSACISYRTCRFHQASSKALLIGSREEFETFLHYIGKTRVSFTLAGYMKKTPGGTESGGSYLGSLENGDLSRVLREKVIDEVLIMQNHLHDEKIQRCLNLCMELGVTTRIVLPMARKDCSSYISSVGTYPVISYHLGSLNGCELAVKRLIDVCGALVGLILASPILLAAAVAIKLESEGPVFFTQTRVGRNGRRFKIMKLRTMTTDAECRKVELLALNEVADGYMFKIKDDPRVTRVGAFLRRTSIDEIPQFFNVLAGNMSLVGTRPPTEDEVSRYEHAHWQRLRIKPGITGMWQISGRSQVTSFDEVVELDTHYIRGWTIFSDIRIILKTVTVVLKRKGAY